LRFGAGIKGKWRNAEHQVLLQVLCRIDARLFTLEWIADDPDVFAKKAVQLYQDKSCWLQAQKNGLAIIEQRYLIALFETELN
jgi:hypothetical protein